MLYLVFIFIITYEGGDGATAFESYAIEPMPKSSRANPWIR